MPRQLLAPRRLAILTTVLRCTFGSPKRKAALMTSLLQNKNLEHQGHDAVFDEGADQMIVNLERRLREGGDVAAKQGMSAHEVRDMA